MRIPTPYTARGGAAVQRSETLCRAAPCGLLGSLAARPPDIDKQTDIDGGLVHDEKIWFGGLWPAPPCTPRTESRGEATVCGGAARSPVMSTEPNDQQL